MQCAQCHDHPFDDWEQRQFYEMASFFGKTRRVESRFTRAVYTTESDENRVLWPPERRKSRPLVILSTRNFHFCWKSLTRSPSMFLDWRPNAPDSVRTLRYT